jgi:flavodoxin
MKKLVVYETKFGNTEKLAQEMAGAIGGQAVKVDQFEESMLDGLKVLIVGGPIWAWNIAAPIKQFLQKLEAKGLSDVMGGAFDTRVDVWFSGDAAKKLHKKLQKLGLEMVLDPASFIVEGREGPLKTGEMERAVEWIKGLN